MAKKKDQGVFTGLVGAAKSAMRKHRMSGRAEGAARRGAAAEHHGKVPSRVTPMDEMRTPQSKIEGMKRRKVGKTSAADRRTQANSRRKTRHR